MPDPLTLPAGEWLTVEAVATWLQVDTKLIYKLAASDVTFPAIKVGGVIRIRQSRLDKWLDQRRAAKNGAQAIKGRLPARAQVPAAIAEAEPSHDAGR
jgi:excisionase family DNA binding protein